MRFRIDPLVLTWHTVTYVAMCRRSLPHGLFFVRTVRLTVVRYLLSALALCCIVALSTVVLRTARTESLWRLRCKPPSLSGGAI